MSQTFCRVIGWNGIGALACLLLASGALGQTSDPALSSGQPTQTQTQNITQSPDLQAFLKEQQALAQELQALITQGATPQQIQAWRQQNAAQLQAQQQLAVALGAASALQPLPTNVTPNIPANASATLKDFLTTQAALAGAQAQIHNQLLQSLPANASQDQISQMQQTEMTTFQRQHASDLQLQAQRTQTLAQESSATATTLPIPAGPNIPPDASPELKTFLTQRYELMKGQIQIINQYATADPATRQAALQQWQQQNAPLIQQFQQAAQNLSASTANAN